MSAMQARIRGDEWHGWNGASLLVTDLRGSCGSAPLTGYYYREARHLSRCRLLVNGEEPWLCEAAAVSPDELTFEFTYPEVAAYGGGGSGQSGDDVPRNEARIPQRALLLHLTYRLAHNHLRAQVSVENGSRESVSCDIALELDADFADIQEAQSRRREQTAPVTLSDGAEGPVFAYEHPRLSCSTRIRCVAPARWDMAHRRMVLAATLPPRMRVDLTLEVRPSPAETDAGSEARADHVASWRQSFARVWAPGNTRFEAVVAANVRDVASLPLLDGPQEEWLALQAGMPLYPAFFGRDALTAGWQMAMVDRGQTLEAAMTRLGRFQSDRVDDWRDEEPGRIPYQMRAGPLARLDLNPYSAYYADFASPLMFVISLANLFAWTGDTAALDRHCDAARRILDWARDFGDRDRDGYLEYRTRSSKGTKNQGWKDSGDAIVYDDGGNVPAPIATCEVQGYWYAAQQLMGILCAARGQQSESQAYLAAAEELKDRFNRDWWSEREQCFALAMDPDKRLIEAPTSNVGHCLACGIVDRTRLDAVVARLFAPDMFSGWGIRTLSSNHAFYDPLSYHRGSVWAVEQATTLFGLRRFGYAARVHELAEALFDLACLYPEFRIPETLGGHARRERPTPGAYPQANAPQLWNASAFPLMVQSMLGILPWAKERLLIVDPDLPAWLPDVIVEGLRVGDAAVTVRFRRHRDGTSDFDVLDKRGELHVIRSPASAGTTDEVGGLIGSFVSGHTGARVLRLLAGLGWRR